MNSRLKSEKSQLKNSRSGLPSEQAGMAGHQLRCAGYTELAPCSARPIAFSRAVRVLDDTQRHSLECKGAQDMRLERGNVVVAS